MYAVDTIADSLSEGKSEIQGREWTRVQEYTRTSSGTPNRDTGLMVPCGCLGEEALVEYGLISFSIQCLGSGDASSVVMRRRRGHEMSSRSGQQ
eukprot:m.170286 g.170286  ORF g.170286 m.170286 type:complete len:94 (-) comp24203_c0_seq1:501-782(-)